MNRTYDNLIQLPCRIVIAGPSGCGKSELTLNLIKRQKEVFDYGFPSKILYCYKESLPKCTASNIEFYNGLPNLEDLKANTLIVIDDFMIECCKDDTIVSLFTRMSRHRNLSVILLVQNIFFKNLRNLTLSATHIVIFKSPRDISFVNYLAKQMFPKHKNYLQEAYAHATKKAHSYLLINITQRQKEEHRVSSSFFAEQAVVYLPLHQ